VGVHSPPNGMAASDTQPQSDSLHARRTACLAAAELGVRLDEEIHRAERHGTPLSCLLLVIENLQEIAREHGSGLPEQTLSYVGGALRRELRDFDRIGRPSERELLIVLPGADGPSGEIVARRMLERMREIKVEAKGARSPLRVSLGLASWQRNASGPDLLARTRAAAPSASEEEDGSDGVSATPFTGWRVRRPHADTEDHPPQASSRIARS